MNAIKQFLEAYWFPTLFLAWLVVWLWRASHRLGRRSTAGLEVQRDEAHTIGTSAPFRRADFAAKAEISRREIAKGLLVGGAILIAAPPALVAISWLVPTLTRGFFRTAMTISVAAAITSLFAFALRASRQTRRSGLICPACGIELVGRGGTRLNEFLLQDRVLETGKCPRCNTQLLDPAEVRPISQTSTRAEHARYIGIIAVLLAGVVALVYFANASISAKRLARCRSLYARAHSASDSVVIDSTHAARGDLVTCGELLGSNGRVR